MLKEMLGIAEGIFQDLHDDHCELETLIQRITSTDSITERSSLFEEVSDKLLAHAHAEQEVLYAPMESSPEQETRRFALEGIREHELVEEQLRKIRAAGEPTGDAWSAELKVLRDLVEHHVKEEESTGFDCARDEFDTEQLEHMGDKFVTRKQALLSKLAIEALN